MGGASSSSCQSAQFGSEDLSSEVPDSIRLAETIIEFRDVRSFKNFNIVANGVVIDSEIPTHLRAKYYELCSSQNAYLHSSLLEDVNCKLVAGAIIEIVNISDAIRAAKVTADLDCRLQAWDKVAKSFEDWGMTVRFLRKRIKKLLSFHSEEQQEMILSKKSERARLETDMRDLETKLVNVKGVA